MPINDSAPVVGRGEIAIEAPPSVVWEVMSRVDEWPRWNPEIRSATLEGPLAPGSRFRWRSGPGEITSTLQEVRPDELLEWTGTSFGVRAVHVWRIRAEGDRAIVTTEESWDGLPARLFRGRSQRTVDAALDSGLRLMKAEAERIARPS